MVVDEPRALGAEENAAGLAGAHELPHLRRPAPRRQDALHHEAIACRGGVDMAKIGDGVLDAVEHPRLLEHEVGAACRRGRLLIGPTVARRHQAELGQAAIEHGARGGADILAELWCDEDDGGPAPGRQSPPIRSRHGA